MAAELLPDAAERRQRGERRVIVRADRHGEGVKEQVLFVDTIALCLGKNLLRDGKAPLCRRGDAVLVQRERHDNAAVLLHQREDRLHALALAVYRIDNGFAVVAAERRLHREGICRVDLERQVGHLLQLADHMRQHGALVNVGQTRIDVEDLRALLRLGDTLGKDKVEIPLAQRLLHALFARRVDALADQHRVVAEPHGVRVGGRDAQVLRLDRHRHGALHRGSKGADIVRRGAAAAARGAHAAAHRIRHLGGKIRRCDIVDRSAVHRLRQPCIRLEQHRHGGAGKQFIHHAAQFGGTERAVGAERRDAHALEQSDHRRRRCPGHQLAVRAVSIGDDDREVTVFAGGKQRRLGLVAVVHRLDEDEVRAVLCAEAHRPGKSRNRILKVERSERAQKSARRSDVERDKLLARRRCGARRPGICNRGGDDRLQLVRSEFQRIRAEGIGTDDVAARIKIRLVDCGHHVRVRKIPALGVFAGRKSARLQERAHAAVQQDDMVLQIIRECHRVTPFCISAARGMPANAVTDLPGDIKRLSPSVSPICRSQSSRAKMSFCASIARSP